MRVRSGLPIFAMLASFGFVASVIVVPGHAAFAQTQAPADPSPRSSGPVSSDNDQQLRQVTLTDKMIEGVLASQKEFDAIAEKLPETAPEKPDPKVTAQFEAVAKKYGFASYDEYNDVIDTISLVLGGFDPATKKYVGADNVIRGQIAAVEADKSIPDEDRKQALEQLNDALKAHSSSENAVQQQRRSSALAASAQRSSSENAVQQQPERDCFRRELQRSSSENAVQQQRNRTIRVAVFQRSSSENAVQQQPAGMYSGMPSERSSSENAVQQQQNGRAWAFRF